MGFPNRQAIEQKQLANLHRLLSSIMPGNGFYGRKLGNLNPKSAYPTLGHFMAQCPPTTKAELVEDQLAHPPFGTNLSFDIAHYNRFHQTSGSTGTPMRWLDTKHSWSTLVANWCHVFHAAGVSAQDRCFFAFSFGPFLGFWTAFEAAASMGCLSIPGGGMRTLGRLRAIVDQQATVLCCTPTYAIHLGQVAQHEAIDLGNAAVKTILVAGEPGGSVPTIRQTIANLWPGAKVYDHHGMTEIGPASLPCPDHQDVLHIIEPGFLTEVVNPNTLQPLEDGELGELILSNLERDGMPLLRYRTGDLVRKKTGLCSCGRSSTRLMGGILGRIDDMVIVRGVNLYPAAIDAVVRTVPQIPEYQVVVYERQGLDDLSIRVEAPEKHANAIKAQLSQQLHASFNLRINVETVALNTLPRFELKAKRWVREEKQHPLPNS